MKKQFYTWSLLCLSFLLGLTACSKENEVNGGRDSQVEQGHLISFRLSGTVPALRAAIGPSHLAPAMDREKAVHSLYAVLYKGNVFYKTIQANGSGSNYQFDALSAGEFNMYLVANPDAELLGKLQAGPSTPQVLGELVASQEPGKNPSSTDLDYFLMTSAATTVTAVKSSTTPVGTPIKMQRVAARFDIFNQVPGLELKTATLKPRYQQSRLSTSADMSGLNADEKVYTLTKNPSIGEIYSYENVKQNATALLFTGTYEGTAIKPFTVNLDGDKAIERNHLYTLVITPKGATVNPGDTENSLDFNIIVNDWNEDVTIEWNGVDLYDTSAPEFTVSGKDITPISSKNPTEIVVTKHTATDIVIKAVSQSTGADLRYTGGDFTINGSGYSIEKGAVSSENGKLVQLFTIHLGENSANEKAFTFDLFNLLDSSAKQSFTVKQRGKADRPANPLTYFAKYNVNKAGDGFATSNANDASGYFNWYEATGTTHGKYNPSGRNVLSNPAFSSYHLPTAEELHALAPKAHYVRFDRSSVRKGIVEAVTINGENKTYVSDYRNVGGSSAYGLRFQSAAGKSEAKSGFPIITDNSMRCAYRYQYINNPDGRGKMLKITVRYLGESFTGDINTISNPSYWTSSSSHDEEIMLPASGIKRWGEPLDGTGEVGYVWSSNGRTSSDEFADDLSFGSEVVGISGSYKIHAVGIRLVRNK